MEHYFEVKMTGPFFGQTRMVGIGTRHTLLQSNQYDYFPLIGRDTCSWGLNYNGDTYHQGNITNHVKVDPDRHDNLLFGVLYDSYYGTVSFDVNGKGCGVAFRDVITNLELYPMACASAAKTVMSLVHTHSSVMTLKALSRGVVRMAIKSEEDLNKLPLPEHLRAYLAFRTHESPFTSNQSSNHFSLSPPSGGVESRSTVSTAV